MMDVKATLRQRLAPRSHGLWEPLAAVAGDPEARGRVAAGLAADALEQGHNGLAQDPNVVGERVEAVAAWDLQLLARLAAGWRSPRTLPSDPMDSDADYWAVAWARSLRHLEKTERIDAHTARSDSYVVASEARILWGKPEPRYVSWTRLVERLRLGDLFFDEMRMLARVPLEEAAVDESHLRACQEAADASREPLALLRILRGRATVLNGSGRSELRRLLREARSLSPGVAALLLELARELQFQDRYELERPFVEVVVESDSPRRVAPLAYTLLSASWQIP
jgi:hypothetical protein